MKLLVAVTCQACIQVIHIAEYDTTGAGDQYVSLHYLAFEHAKDCKSLRKPLGQGYSKLQARADRVTKAAPGKRNVFQEALDNPGAVSRRGFGEGYTRKEEAG